MQNYIIFCFARLIINQKDLFQANASHIIFCFAKRVIIRTSDQPVQPRPRTVRTGHSRTVQVLGCISSDKSMGQTQPVHLTHGSIQPVHSSWSGLLFSNTDKKICPNSTPVDRINPTSQIHRTHQTRAPREMERVPLGSGPFAYFSAEI